ncbi:hypothetical protein PoB_000271800 [Plakobranchus ocellatus]|uniref:Secreted protein n=1 Tax=Plakobranchus ocellatus TaxID=259542 RepID=A0AAV3Y1I5_9GAST|nr:hypothetical protein PoB_000271800 [Plakobranchus ocellatus]
MPDKMAALKSCVFNVYQVVLVFSSVAFGLIASNAPADRCPMDYRYRVETCVMEAQVAPQAGGGLRLITERNKLEELCSRGILQKTIDCLRDIYNRCSGNATRRHELDMLFSVDDWRQGRALLCEDLYLFKDHFDCVSQFAPGISGCILSKTRQFRDAVTQAGIVEHKTLHDITCNFAENIVTCLERPLSRACPIKVVETMTSALHRFLPPACAPVPAAYSDAASADTTEQGNAGSSEGGDQQEQQAEEADNHGQQEPMHLETIVVEGGEWLMDQE